MNKEDVYDVWACDDGFWQKWVKPALFAHLENDPGNADARVGHEYREPGLPWSDIDVSWAPDAALGAFILVDLQGAASIELGLALTSRGYCPIVAINACSAPGEAINMTPVLQALREGARFPHAFPRASLAPPAFLLDARRMSATRALVPGVFDNRWMVFQQDLPSAELLLRQGRSRVVVVLPGEEIADDLRQVLYAWQRGGIEVLVKRTSDALPPNPTTIQAPSLFHRVLGRPPGAGELRRNTQGSFGMVIPEPSHG